MVIYTVYPGRGGTPLEPQLFYIPDRAGPGPKPFAQYDWPNPQQITWYQALNYGPAPTQTIPANQFNWPNPPLGNPPPVQNWTYQYPLQLIGQDRLPVGESIYVLPPQLVDTQVRSWIQFRQLSAVQTPFVQTDWPNPREFRDYRTWVSVYPLVLIGQDKLPNRQQDWPNPQPVTWYQDWKFSPKVPPVTNLLPPGQETNFIASGPDYPIQLRTLINSPAPPASGTLPPTNYDWPLPRDYQRVTPSWTYQYLLTLIGMDQLPIGGAEGQNQQFGIPVPPPYVDYTWLHSPAVPPVVVQQLPPGARVTHIVLGPDYPVQLRTLINSPAPVFVAPTQLPFFQTDWPLPQGYPLPVKDWEFWYNLNLIGMDQFPVGGNTTGGQNDSHGIIFYPVYPLQSIIENNLPLLTFVQPQQPPGARLTDLPYAPRLEYYRDFNENIILLFPPPPPPPVTELHFRPWLAHMGRMGNLGGLS